MRVLRNGIEFSELTNDQMGHILGGNPNRRGNGRGNGNNVDDPTADITRGGDVEGDPELDLD